MCGIIATWNFTISEQAVRRGLASLSHRGPDANDLRFLSDGKFQSWIGHHRLAIIDLSENGKQPFYSPDGRYVISYNGEIFNYKTLRNELEATGVHFRTQTDTEVLLWALIRWGIQALSRLDGQFAFIFVDCQAGKLLVARDQLGVKPLYYAQHQSGWVFASEIKAFWPLGLSPQLNQAALGEYLANLWVMEPDTLFKGVYKLPAATWMSFDAAGIQKGCYWAPSKSIASFSSANQALEALTPKLERAVASQMVADVPVGAYVSGGVDSSIVARLALNHTTQGLITVGARFTGVDQKYESIPDDGQFIDLLVAQYPAFQHTNVLLQPNLFEEYVRLIRYMDEPIADPAMVPAYLLAHEARAQGAIVMLSGMGADELFGGYARYTALPLIKRFQGLPGGIRALLLKAALLGQRVPNGPIRRHAHNAKRVLNSLHDAWPLAYNNLSGHYSLEEVDALVGAGWREAYTTKLSRITQGWEEESLLRQAQLIDLKGFLASHNNIYSDKASMAASVEVRVPLMNVELTEFALSLPDSLKVSNRQNKVLLKQACAQIVGSSFAYRPKAGFGMPIRSWLRGSLQSTAQKLILKEQMYDFFPGEKLKKLVEDHIQGTRENTWELWSLMTLSLWMDTFEVGESASSSTLV